MANKILKTLTLPNAQGEPVTYELHPEWDNIENKPNFDDLGGVGEAYEEKGEIFNDYQNNIAFGAGSHAEGFSTIANGDCSHAEGDQTRATGAASHAEGSFTNAWGAYAHAEGGADSPVVPDTITNESTTEEIIAAQNDAIYNRMAFSLAKGDCSHIEGFNNLALGAQSHAEGSEVIASGNSAHAEGSATVASGLNAHAEGGSTIASGKNAHAEGQQTRAKGEDGHAEGYRTLAEGISAHAEGYASYAEGYASHSEGNASHAEGPYSHSEGYESHAAGFSSHAEGYRTHVEGDFAHVEGIGEYITCNITGDANTTVYQVSSLDGLILGACVRLDVRNSGIILYRTAKIININTDNSTITVDKTLDATTSLLNTQVQVCVSGLALSHNTHVEGNKTIAAGRSQHVQGEFNIADPEYDYSNTNSKNTRGKYAHIVGNGSSHANRSNAHTLDWDGNAWYAGRITAEGSVLTQGSLVIGNTNKIVMLKNAAGTSDPTGYSIGSIQKGSTFVPYFKNNADNKLAPIQIGEPYSDECATTKGYVDSTTTSSPNLLDNWYFADPINQRGATQYTAEGFCLDRWSFEQWKPSKQSVQLRNGCVAIVSGAEASTNNTTKLRQTLVDLQRLAGKTVTFSAKLKNVTVNGNPRLTIYYGGSKKDVAITSADTNSIISVTETLPTTLSSMYVAIGNDGNAAGKGNFDIEIESVKLEIGSISTLANDAPPKKSEQLLECQRYYIRWSNTAKQQAFSGGAAGTAVYAAVQLPTAMQGTATPTVTYAELDIYNFVSNGSVATKSCGCNMLGSRNSVVLWVTYDATSACPGQTPASIRIGENGYIALSCEV